MPVGPSRISIWSRFLLAGCFVLAGLNHFLQPAFYLPLIPDYLPWPQLINQFSGLLEILLGIGVLIKPARKTATWGLLVLLVLFIPSHVYFIRIGACIDGGLCTPMWLAWLRLLLIHPLLMLWIWFTGKP